MLATDSPAPIPPSSSGRARPPSLPNAPSPPIDVARTCASLVVISSSIYCVLLEVGAQCERVKRAHNACE